jgi:hypothetical protein
MNKYSSLKEKISAEKAERNARYEIFSTHWDRAWQEGMKAAMAATPTPMIVTDREGNHIDYVPEGPCGFAWINVPGNTSFGRWLKKRGLARPDYPTGLSVWISAYEQSHDRKAAHARAMARYLQEQGIQCCARSRLD